MPNQPRLTALMRETLQTAQANGELRREPQGAWPAAPQTIRALERHGLVAVSERRSKRGVLLTVWSITDAGRLVLNPPPRVRRDTVHSMRARGWAVSRVMIGQTWTLVRSPEPEKVAPEDLSSHHGQQSHDRWQRAQDRRAEANRLARRLRAA